MNVFLRADEITKMPRTPRGGGGGGGVGAPKDGQGGTSGRAASPFELAVAGTLAVSLFGAAVLKAVVMSARYDPGLSPAWRERCATVEALLGFGGGGGLGGRGEGDASTSTSTSSSPSGGRFSSGAARLPGVRPNGWFMGRANDLSDHQWRTFRGNLPKLALVALATVPLTTAVRRWAPKRASAPFHALYGVAFVAYLHGVRILWIAALALVHFGVCRAAAGVPRVGPLAVWASGLGCLVAVQFWADGWSFERAAASAAGAYLSLSPSSSSSSSSSSSYASIVGAGRAMDGWYQGAVPR